MKSEAGPFHVIDFPVTLESRSHWLLGRCSRRLRRSRAGANVVRSRARRVTVPEHDVASKSSAAASEAFSNACIDREVLSKTAAHRLVAKYRDTRSICAFYVERFSVSDSEQCPV
jgi:hypothetical protein